MKAVFPPRKSREPRHHATVSGPAPARGRTRAGGRPPGRPDAVASPGGGSPAPARPKRDAGGRVVTCADRAGEGAADPWGGSTCDRAAHATRAGAKVEVGGTPAAARGGGSFRAGCRVGRRAGLGPFLCTPDAVSGRRRRHPGAGRRHLGRVPCRPPAGAARRLPYFVHERYPLPDCYHHHQRGRRRPLQEQEEVRKRAASACKKREAADRTRRRAGKDPPGAGGPRGKQVCPLPPLFPLVWGAGVGRGGTYGGDGCCAVAPETPAGKRACGGSMTPAGGAGVGST